MLVLELSVVLDGPRSGSAGVVLDVLLIDGVSVGVGEVGEIVEGSIAIRLAGGSDGHASKGDDGHGELHHGRFFWGFEGEKRGSDLTKVSTSIG